MKILFTFFLLTVGISSFAQDSLSYKSYRSVWSISPRFGVGDKQTRADFTTYGSVGLRREFALFKLLSLNATASYSSVYGRYGNPNLNVLGAGAGLTLYPIYLFNRIFGKIYPNQKINEKDYNDLYIDITAEFSLNNTKYGSAGNVSGPRVEASFRRISLNKALFLVPKFGEHLFVYPTQLANLKSDQSFFFYIGAAVGLNPKPKK